MSLKFLMQALKCALIVNITAYKSQIKSQKSNKKTREEEADEVVKKLAGLYIFFFIMVFICPNTVFHFYCKVCFAIVTTHYSI